MSLPLPTIASWGIPVKLAPTGSEELRWENVRFSTLWRATTDGSGLLYPRWSPPFTVGIYGITVSMDFSGGPRDWLFGIGNVNGNGFDVLVTLGVAPTAVVGTSVGIRYLAIGA